MRQNRNKVKGKKALVTGAVEALGNNVYVYGEENQTAKYVKTTEALEYYCGRKYGRTAKLLMQGTEEAPEEPVVPTKTTDDTLQFLKEKYRAEHARYLRLKDEHIECRSKVFSLVKGQCTLTMRNKLESLSVFSTLEKDDDVVGLLEAVKDLAFETENTNYGYCTMVDGFNRVLKVSQGKSESLASYYKQWWIQVEVLEGKWGEFGPVLVPKGDKSSETRHRSGLAR